MGRTRIKICGITSEEDARQAVACGADALGFMLVPHSKRFIKPAAAARIAATLPPFVSVVGVVVNESDESLQHILDEFPVDTWQFHGDETPGFCNRSGRPYYKVLPATGREEIQASAAQYPDASAIMLDTSVGGQFGGTGRVFDWSIVPALSSPLIVAGGLDPDNVGAAVRELNPWAVDVSTGVEASAGVKDPDKVAAFIEAVRNAEREVV